jgi:hypothetical protein
MDFLGGARLRHVWKFILGHATPKDFEQWLYSDPDAKAIFGETLYLDLISVNYRDRNSTGALKEPLFQWAKRSSPPRWQGLELDLMTVIELPNGIYRRLLPTGYWQSEQEPGLPHPRGFVDARWRKAERLQMIDYLSRAYIVRGALGFSWCRMGCPKFIPEMGRT